VKEFFHLLFAARARAAAEAAFLGVARRRDAARAGAALYVP
jgi:hypothetical protein